MGQRSQPVLQPMTENLNPLISQKDIGEILSRRNLSSELVSWTFSNPDSIRAHVKKRAAVHDLESCRSKLSKASPKFGAQVLNVACRPLAARPGSKTKVHHHQIVLHHHFHPIDVQTLSSIHELLVLPFVDHRERFPGRRRVPADAVPFQSAD